MFLEQPVPSGCGVHLAGGISACADAVNLAVIRNICACDLKGAVAGVDVPLILGDGNPAQVRVCGKYFGVTLVDHWDGCRS